jgi:hypothetical protein
LRFHLEINSFSKFSFLLEVGRELPQRLTLNTFFVAPSFLVVCLHSLTLFALAFLCVTHSHQLIFVLSQTCYISSARPIFCPTVASNFYSSWNKPLDFANFFWSWKHDS